MAACYPGFELGPPPPPVASRQHTPLPHKDYSRPLHVDCSVEYELPNQAKPPEGSRCEPLLMIHPCYYRRAESQRRSPFINNLPTRGQGLVAVGGRRPAAQPPRLVPIQQYPVQTLQAIQAAQAVQAVRYPDPLMQQQQVQQVQQVQMQPQHHLQQQQQVQVQQPPAVSHHHPQQQVQQPLQQQLPQPVPPQPVPQTQVQQQQVQPQVQSQQPVQQPVQVQQQSAQVHQQAVQQQVHQQQQVAWNQLEPVPVYTKPVAKHGKRDPMLCGGGDFSSGSDSGVSAGHWTDTDRSPLAPELRLQRDFTIAATGTDSGIATPVSSLAEDKAVLSELLAATCGSEVNNNLGGKEMVHQSRRHHQQQHQHHQQAQQHTHGPLCPATAGGRCQCGPQQPAVGVAAVAAASCKSCFLHPQAAPYQRLLQQPWAGVTAPTQYPHQPAAAAMPSSAGGGKQRRAAVEPGPEHAASSLHARRPVPWARSGGNGPAKRSRTAAATATAAAALAATMTNHHQQPPQPDMMSSAVANSAWAASWQNCKDCGPVCKTCCGNSMMQPPDQPQHHQQQQQQQQQQQWGSYYCRGASEDGTRILWNNENMLRLFQV